MELELLLSEFAASAPSEELGGSDVGSGLGGSVGLGVGVELGLAVGERVGD